MNNLPAVINGDTDLIHFDDDKIALIKRTIAVNATDDELSLFLHQCQRTGLDPLARQIYFQKYKMKDGRENMAIITGIDGYRLVADRTNRYAGSDEPVFVGCENATAKGEGYQHPTKATVTVWKLVANTRVPFTSSAFWKEYYPGDYRGHMWRKMPHVMLAKCAESAALRKAFPADLSGIYTREEMAQADGDIVDAPKGPEWPVEDEPGPTITPSDDGAGPDTDKETIPADAPKLMAAVKFVEHMTKELGFRDDQHTRATVKLLINTTAVPNDTDKRKRLFEALQAYRHLRDDKGLNQDDALTALADEEVE